MAPTISDRTFFIVMAILVIVAIAGAANHFLLKKNYEFLVEAPCNPSATTCFVRDCSGGECPPNGLESYRVFSVSAADAAVCGDEACAQECIEGTVACSEMLCGMTEGDECSWNTAR